METLHLKQKITKKQKILTIKTKYENSFLEKKKSRIF